MENAMKLNTHIKLGLLLGITITNITAIAQVGGNYSLSWNTLDGAGGTCAGGTFVLNGTVGQPEASTASVGGRCTLTGGFWTGVAEVGPPLFIARSGPNVIVSWTASATGFYLQHCTDLGRKDWVSNATPVLLISADNVVFEPTGTNRFYRLIKP